MARSVRQDRAGGLPVVLRLELCNRRKVHRPEDQFARVQSTQPFADQPVELLIVDRGALGADPADQAKDFHAYRSA